MLRLVFRRGFAGLALALAGLALAIPALAKQGPGSSHAQGPPSHAQGPPSQEQGPPPQSQGPESSPGPPEHAGPPAHAGPDSSPSAHGAPQGEPPAHDAPEGEQPRSDDAQPPAEPRANASSESAAAPAPEEPGPAAPQAPGRVGSRSFGEPQIADPLPPADLPSPQRDTATATAPRRAGQFRGGPAAPAPRATGPELTTFRGALRAATTAGPAAGGAAVAAEAPAAPAAAATPATESSDAEPRPQSAEPSESLPVRIVPRPIRRIVEVVPAELWVALGLLALLALALAVSSWIQARRARRLHRQRQALLQEVGVLQAALLPAVPADVPASVAYRPVAGERAGGDFYDAFALADGATAVILGEAPAAGREALARTTFIRYTLRAFLEAGLTPREVVKVGSESLAEHLESGFATVTVAVHDPVSGRLTYSSAGQAPPVVAGPQPFEPVTACSSPPLGIGDATGFRQSTFTLTAGSTACLYTRGVVEARAGGAMLGIDTLEAELAALPADAGAEDLLDRVAARADEVADDMAVCLLRAPEGAPATGVRIEELEVDEREVGDSLEHFLRACGVPLAEVPGVLREAGEAARREGSATVRVRLNEFRPGVDVVPGNLVRLEERRRASRVNG